MQGRAERTIRGSLLGAVAVILAAAAHAAGGGNVPGWLAIAVAVVAASLVGTFLVGRRPSAVRTAAIVGIGQAGLHYLFVGLGGPGVAIVSGHHHGASGLHLDPSDGHAMPSMGASMLVAHIVAAALTFVLVWSAEAALWRMLHDALRRILALTIAPMESTVATVAAVDDRIADTASVVIPFRRGPPTLSFA